MSQRACGESVKRIRHPLVNFSYVSAMRACGESVKRLSETPVACQSDVSWRRKDAQNGNIQKEEWKQLMAISSDPSDNYNQLNRHKSQCSECNQYKHTVVIKPHNTEYWFFWMININSLFSFHCQEMESRSLAQLSLCDIEIQLFLAPQQLANGYKNAMQCKVFWVITCYMLVFITKLIWLHCIRLLLAFNYSAYWNHKVQALHLMLWRNSGSRSQIDRNTNANYTMGPKPHYPF